MSSDPGLGELGQALQACEQQQFDTAEHLLRWGNLRQVAPPRLEPSGRWLRLGRAPKLIDGATNDDLTSAIAGLAASGTHFKVLIIGTGAYFSLGPTSAEDWFRRVLAPRFVFDPPRDDADQPNLLPGGSAATGLRLMAIPPVREEEQHQLQHASQWVPVMERLFANSGQEWAVLMDFQPVNVQAIADQLGLVSNGLKSLAIHRSTRVQQDEINSVEVVNPTVERVTRQLITHRSLLDRARLLGGWRAGLYTIAPRPEQAAAVTASFGAPMRPSADSDWVATPIPVVGQGDRTPPLEALGTLSSADLADLIAPPRSEAGRIRIAHPLPQGAPMNSGGSRVLPIASRLGTDDAVELDLEDLEGHGFICGMTGSGKTTTVTNMLLGMWNAHDIPFLIVDPVKADYEQHAGLFKGGLNVIDARSLVMNVLEPWPEFDADIHIGMVVNAFRGSFSMPTPMPYVLARLLEAMKADLARGHQPNLHDLRADLNDLVPRLGYAHEIESNIRAALGTRLDLLVDPMRADRVAGVGNTMLHEALRWPTVIQLVGVADEDERAFIMTMIATYIAQAARLRGNCNGIHHVTVLEEAHRIMPEPRGPSDPETGDAKSMAAEQLAGLLAEIRSYGESVLVLDQSPSAVARNVVRNTNLKILQRVVDPIDRAIAGGSVGLTEQEATCLLELGPGEAVVSSRRAPEPQSVTFRGPPAARPVDAVPQPPVARPCCNNPVRHHRAELLADQIENWVQLELVSKIVEPDGNCQPTAQLAAFAETHNVSLSCVSAIGIRRVVRAYGSALDLDLSQRFDHEKVGEATVAIAGLAEVLRPVLLQRKGPFETCKRCPGQCAARVFVTRGFGGRTGKLERMASPERSGSKMREAVDAWLVLMQRDLKPLVGRQATNTLVHCSVVHRLAESGHGTTISRTSLLPPESQSPGDG